MPAPLSITRPARESPHARASILICAYGHRAVTEMSLSALERALGPALGRDFELVLVDNASPDDTAELFDRWRDRAVVIISDHNRNFAGGNNAAAAAARGRVLIFMNNDVEVVPGALEQLVETASAPGVGIAGLRLLYPDGTLQHGGVGFFRPPGGPPVPWHLFHHQAGDLPAALASFDLDVVTAACMAMPRELFESLGGFDEGYVNGWEDTDLCLRARLAGRRTVYRGDIHCVHHEGVSRGRGQTPQGLANANRFVSRWNEMLDDDAELVAELFDAEFVAPRQAPEDVADGATIAVRGQLTGLAPEADEARAILWALESDGWQPAARDVPFAFLAPRLTAGERAPVRTACARPARDGALYVDVPVGAGTGGFGGDVLRLAGVPTAPVPSAREIWVPSSLAADALLAAGAPGDRIAVVRPPVPAPPLGAGDSGVRAIVPGHDLGAAAEVLRGLAAHDDRQICVMPSVASAGIAALVRELLPGAELVGPCASEASFAVWAGAADVVVCADPSDRYQRRALVAAAAGTAVTVLDRGPASEVLGDSIAVSSRGLAHSLRSALETRDERGRRRAAVAATCGTEQVTDRLQAPAV